MHSNKKRRKKLLNESTYAFNKSNEPYPQSAESKPSPPKLNSAKDTKSLFKPIGQLSKEEVVKEYMSAYKKAERLVIVNFYTGGGAYKKGIMDAIYRGKNPLNP